MFLLVMITTQVAKVLLQIDSKSPVEVESSLVTRRHNERPKISTLEVERVHACLFADPVPCMRRGNSAPTSEHVVFAFDSVLKSRHEVGSA